MGAPAIVLIGTLDTKGAEYAYLQARIEDRGARTILVDVGTGGPPAAGVTPDISSAEVASLASAVGRAPAGTGVPAGRSDRGSAVAAMGLGAERLCRKLHDEGRLDAVIALGGSGGTYIATRAMRALPLGVPKLMVSTMASAEVGAYVGTSDIWMAYTPVDICGLNRVLVRTLDNVAAAVVAAAGVPPSHARPGTVIAASMMGVTTPGVSRARARLEELGYEVLVFHANGTGGRSLEDAVAAGLVSGVLDLTTAELGDELFGGILSAGPDRLDAAARMCLPQVVSLGGLDEIAFGPIDSLPAGMRDRVVHVHNPAVTLVRTSPAESRLVGRLIGRKLSRARGRVAVLVPRRGLSDLSVPGGPFWDPEADAALIAGLRETLGPHIEVRELEACINDETFALAAADRLHELMRQRHGNPRPATEERGEPVTGAGVLLGRDRPGEQRAAPGDQHRDQAKALGREQVRDELVTTTSPGDVPAVHRDHQRSGR